METLNYLFKKYNIDPSQKSPIEIRGVGRLDFIRWIKELDFKVGAEIGVDRAEYSKLLCEGNAQMKLYGVDPWLKHPEYREYTDQAEMDGIYEEAKFRMRDYIRHGQYIIVKKLSMDALDDFEDNSLDFVYIDANHEAPFVYQDIDGWAKKVRPGGMVAGHDYVRIKALDFVIKDALDEYVLKNNIKPWFILGSYAKEPKVIRDRVRSWMFIK